MARWASGSDSSLREARELVDNLPHCREVGVAGIRRGRPYTHEREAGRLDDVAHVEREAESIAVPREHLTESRLVDRHLAAPECFDAVGEHVAYDHPVPELGEAGSGDEADVAGTEDGDAPGSRGHDPRQATA